MAVRKKKKTVRKQSSSPLSTLASEIMNETRNFSQMNYFAVKVRDLRKLCASVLSQDETKGQKRK